MRVLPSVKYVVENAKDVQLDDAKVSLIGSKIQEQVAVGLGDPEIGYGSKDSFENDVQLIFLEDVVNFCYWAEKDMPKWEVEWPKGEVIKGGAYAMMGCFKRALAENVPILEAKYLSELTTDQTNSLFRSNNGIDIPLQDKRGDNLREAGRVLEKDFDGKFVNVVEEARCDAVKLVELIADKFSSFKDISRYRGHEVFFLKRAQICANDIGNLKSLPMKMTSMSELTAFADYKLPQILREFGIINYTSNLAKKIDNMMLIKHDSSEEIEIRAATVWGVELIRRDMSRYTAAEIDNAIWLMSQRQINVRPYHRTYTIFY